MAGLAFETTNGSWLQGYWWWCCNTGQSTAAVTCALWQTTGIGTAVKVPNTTATSGTLTAGAWNWIPLATPVPLSPGPMYIAAIGMSNSFPDTNNYFNSGNPGASGISNGPLFVGNSIFGDINCSSPWSGSQTCLYSTTSSDPTTAFPGSGSAGFNSWVDVQITDTDPLLPGVHYRLWPTCVAGMNADHLSNPDAAANFVLSTEIRTTQAISFSKIWWYSYTGVNGAGSPPNAGTGGATTQLPTAVDIWSVDPGGLTGSNFYHNGSPSWSGAAGSGWVSVNVGSVIVAPGIWRVSVYNHNATPDHWSSFRFNFWAAQSGARAAVPNGITFGPLYAPNNANATLTYSFGNAGTTGTHVAGDVTETGQGAFQTGPANADPGDTFPNLNVGVNSTSPGPTYENFWIDFEVVPVQYGTVAFFASSTLTVTTTGGSGAVQAGLTMSATAGMTVIGRVPPKVQELLSDFYQWTVSSGGTGASTAGATETMHVVSATGAPAAAAGVSQFRVVDAADTHTPPEVMVVTNVAGTTWTVTRAAESGAPWAHAANWTAIPVLTATGLNNYIKTVLAAQ
jgi:hypothetical protein